MNTKQNDELGKLDATSLLPTRVQFKAKFNQVVGEGLLPKGTWVKEILADQRGVVKTLNFFISYEFTPETEDEPATIELYFDGAVTDLASPNDIEQERTKLLTELLSEMEGLEVDIEATTKHIESVGGGEQEILMAELDADDRHEVLNDVRDLIKRKLDI